MVGYRVTAGYGTADPSPHHDVAADTLPEAHAALRRLLTRYEDPVPPLPDVTAETVVVTGSLFTYTLGVRS